MNACPVWVKVFVIGVTGQSFSLVLYGGTNPHLVIAQNGSEELHRDISLVLSKLWDSKRIGSQFRTSLCGVEWVIKDVMEGTPKLKVIEAAFVAYSWGYEGAKYVFNPYLFEEYKRVFSVVGLTAAELLKGTYFPLEFCKLVSAKDMVTLEMATDLLKFYVCFCDRQMKRRS